MKFVVDTNLPPALAGWLVEKGHEAQHVSELRLERAADRAIWERARVLGACVVTKDEDFVLMQARDPSGPMVLWVRIGIAVRRVLLDRFAESWPAVVAMLEKGEKAVEIR